MNKIPSVGSTVKVTVRFRNIAYGETNPYKDIVFSGKVIKSPKWVKADCFSIETGNPRFPISIIDSKYMVDMKLVSGKTDNIRKFNVKGSKGSHQVVMNGDIFSCDCIGFKYHSRCKHINAVKENTK